MEDKELVVSEKEMAKREFERLLQLEAIEHSKGYLNKSQRNEREIHIGRLIDYFRIDK